MANSFWQENNGWWKRSSRRMDEGTASTGDWDEANRRLWCLSWRIPEAKNLGAQDRSDLVQTMFERLLRPQGLRRLTEVDTPAHYLAKMMRNHLRNEHKRAKIARRAMERFGESAGNREDHRPDRQVEWNELCAKARFIVNHVVSADDRKALWWFYKDGFSAKKIGKRLGISEAAALQRLVRARKRVREEFEK